MLNPSDIVYSRRLFLSRGVQLLSVAGTLPLFLDHSARCLAADYAANPAGAGRPDDHVLVVIQLAGGNDGLNTVVPLGNDDYYNARPRIAVAKNAALKLTDDWGVHPSATGFKKLYDAGDLAIVHAVSYPNANRSHFRATDIWTTEPPTALQGAKYVPLTFSGAGGRGYGAAAGGGRPTRGGAGAAMGNDTLTKLNGDDPASVMAAAHPSAAAKAEDFLQRTALNARVYADKIRRASASVENKAAYPQTGLARDLKLVAQLIASGMPTRVYYVKLGGFDTHADQLQRHAALLDQLAGGLAAFVDDLKQLGQGERVTTMTFSEFGRRVHDNGSGTDHGEAAPMFIVGGRVKPGFHGTFPGLAADKLSRGDVAFTTDFRRVYGTLLQGWLGADDTKILGGKFESMDILKQA
jgi:uncharacterized protein (DUF1501 family)